MRGNVLVPRGQRQRETTERGVLRHPRETQQRTMRFKVLACDFDGTLATDGRVSDSTIAALERLRASGRMAMLVTGRQFDDLQRVFDRLDLFERVVAEDGGLLYSPTERRERVLAEAPPDKFVRELRRRNVKPLSVGRTIVATERPNETRVLAVIRELGLDLHIVFNKEAVMIQPAATTKRTGLEAALDELGLSPHNVVGVGDGENDLAFLRLVECAVAVRNAVPSLRRAADWTTDAARGEGVEELIDRLVRDDLVELSRKLERHAVLLGTEGSSARRLVRLDQYATSLLVAGSSKAGKSSLTLGILERLIAGAFQFVLIDPEGDYEALHGAINLGTEDSAPALDEVMSVLERPDRSVVVCLLAIAFEDRPAYVAELLSRLDALRARTARPHWLVFDEAHHVFPAQRGGVDEVLPRRFGGLVLIGLRPKTLSPAVLDVVNTVCAVGEAPARTLREFCDVVGERAPAAPRGDLEKGQAVVWRRGQRRARAIEVEPAQGDRQRHRRKYAEGDLPRDRSFHFRGPGGRLNLRARNLSQFLELADGVDDSTWLFHLRAGDYSRWVSQELKDEHLADDIEGVERQSGASAAESRRRVRALIEARYAPPA